MKATVPPREQAHALCIYIAGGPIDEDDDMADWIDGEAEVELRATEARDFTWTDDPEPEPAKPVPRPKWPAMSESMIKRQLASMEERGAQSDDDEAKTEPQRPTWTAETRKRTHPDEDGATVEPYRPPKREAGQLQKYRIECDGRIRCERLLLGDTVADWLARIIRQTGEEWHCLVYKGERTDEETPMT
jgi:hypothetical protein